MSDDDEQATRTDAERIEGMAVQVTAAFSDDGPLSRGLFLYLQWCPKVVADIRETLVDVAANNPDVTFRQVVEDYREHRVQFYDAVADSAGLAPLERASLLAAAQKGFDLALGARQAFDDSKHG